MLSWSYLGSIASFCLLDLCEASSRNCPLSPRRHLPGSQASPNGKGTLGCQLWPLDNPVSYEHDVDFESSDTFPEPATGVKHKYTARVSPRHMYTARAGLQHKHAARMSAQHRCTAGVSPQHEHTARSQAIMYTLKMSAEHKLVVHAASSREVLLSSCVHVSCRDRQLLSMPAMLCGTV